MKFYLLKEPVLAKISKRYCMIAGVDYTGISVTFLCHDGKGSLLFHKRSEHCRDEQGTWDWGAGKMEFGETIEEALRREVREEYGCEIMSIDAMLPPNTWLSTSAGKPAHWVTFPHIVRVDRNQARINEPRSMSELGWFTFDTLPQPLHRGVQKEVDVHRNYFLKHLV